jgi:hypothetical protein
MIKYSILGVLVVLGITGFNVTAQANLNDGLVAYYPLNGNADDESGNGNDGTVYGASLTEDRFGNANSAYNFDGVDDYIEKRTPSSVLNANLQDWTISAWINTSRTGQIQTIVSRYECGWNCPSNGAGSLYDLQVTEDGYGSYGIRNTVPPFAENTSVENNVSITDGTWHHISGVLNRSTLEITIFIDGYPVNSVSVDGLTALDDRQGSPLSIGRTFIQRWAQPREYFLGTIDDIRIYNRALSESEIRELYNESSTCEESYDEGYNDGYTACQADPNCGGGRAATYDIWANILTIPNLMIGSDSYNVELKGPYNVISATPNN